ncbi:ATP-binding protein [Streptomyces sp. NBC_00038]|uniref:ATP-binding protein n=1 Tax=Streptomyces sp. NBC_00038 TaxID=2903615 RepID=UPI0022574FD7|nr:ATP-binding protein [Streptomyces sp. NBC_00038]MCX5561081.1 ATP-binding protein [Streptomyces sp. NBC_00038]
MRIPVEVRPDFIEKVARRTDPLGAVEELVWNSLDADATDVYVELELDDFGGVQAVVVKDNGHGIPSATVESAFKGMGGSWKRTAPGTESGRQLHGRHGYGRFRVLALGSNATWTSVSESPSDMTEVVIRFQDGDSDFDVDERTPTSPQKPGTIVRVTGEAQRKQRLTAERAREELTSRLAMYLSKYPAATVWWCGTALDPSEAIEGQPFEEVLDIGIDTGGPGPLLRIVEWKTKPPRRELLICDDVGVHRVTLLAQIQAPDYDFTAYVLWDKFANLTDHDLLEGEFEHSDSLLGSTVKAARNRLRTHFREQERERTRKLVQQWIEEGVYPYSGQPSGPVEVAERDTFNEVASLVSRQLKGPKSARRTQMVLLREALRRQPTAMPKVLDELFALSGPQKERLEDLVDRTPMANLIAANAETIDRIDALSALRTLLFEFESRYTMREKDQLHRMLEKELWIFGDEYGHAVSEIGLTKALNRHLPRLDGRTVPQQRVQLHNGTSGRLDLLLSCVSGAGRTKQHLVVELKRPRTVLSETEVAQINSYAYAVTTDERYRHDDQTHWEFWLVGNSIDGVVQWQHPDGYVKNDDRVTIRIITWGAIIDACEERLRKQRERLDYASDQTHTIEYAQRVHSDADVVPLLAPREDDSA